MTNAETSFFRDPLLFDELRNWVLPSCSTRPGAGARGFWCAACSTQGRSPTAWRCCSRLFPEALAAGRVRLIATDVSRRNLERVRAGCYTRGEINRGLPAAMLVRWFEDEGGCWRIHPRLRELVELRHLSLIDPWPALPSVDLLLLRNVLLYWPMDRRELALARAARQLARTA
ncbi:hypothetical protein G6O69_39055 [Pseudenhygromyxa sp. WMMC2535]|uniref:CheR family methyltransferase n=1 Tax=Pseudenhygromyxa sp. WMMC2535 TaxID=2712867 RepID=UPI001594FD4D|nr:CheR family methyltransferase [Pseudenhygromyxa sp. WMMC2535]NVB43858.1 hypothetical protein [Pseudenhygromyxa sp. WMMC2535]